MAVKTNKGLHSMVRPLIYDDNFMKMVESIDGIIPLMNDIVVNMMKARGGNKLAAQRARTATIKFEKKAKQFRKVSIPMRKEAKDV